MLRVEVLEDNALIIAQGIELLVEGRGVPEGPIDIIGERILEDRARRRVIRVAAELLARYAISATVPKDRTYFRSVNFRSTCGLLLEIATDGPGFAIDEPLDRLGEKLALPPFLEARRGELEALLPRIASARALANDPFDRSETDKSA